MELRKTVRINKETSGNLAGLYKEVFYKQLGSPKLSGMLRSIGEFGEEGMLLCEVIELFEKTNYDDYPHCGNKLFYLTG